MTTYEKSIEGLKAALLALSKKDKKDEKARTYPGIPGRSLRNS